MATTRRNFLKNSALGMAGLTLSGAAMPKSSYSRILGANDRINLAVIGLGRRVHAWPEAIALPEANARLLYLCDVMQFRRVEAAERFGGVLGYQARLENDLRKVFDDSDVDAVIIATPDHWQTPATTLAVQAGKHVYVEKPGSHNPHETEITNQLRRSGDRVIQLGNQRRSSGITKRMIREIHNGLIGEPYMAVASYYNRRGEVPVAVEAPIPDGLDWDLFQGPAPRQSYKHDTWDYNWHWYGWTWGTAEAGNNAIHAIDIARWALQVDYPERVDTVAHKYHFRDDGWTMYDTMDAIIQFPGDKVIKWDCKSRNRYNTYGGQGPIIYGTEGTVVLGGSGYELFDREGNLIRSETDEEDTGRSKINNHVTNYLGAIRGTAEQNSPIEEGNKSAMLCHLMNISARTGKGLDIDSRNGRIYDREGMALWSREYEPGWEPGVEVEII